MRKPPRVTTAMLKSLVVVRDHNGRPRRGGVMVVPAILAPEVWSARAQASQEALRLDMSNDKGRDSK